MTGMPAATLDEAKRLICGITPYDDLELAQSHCFPPELRAQSKTVARRKEVPWRCFRRREGVRRRASPCALRLVGQTQISRTLAL